MGMITTYVFTDPSDFTLDDILITDAVAALAPVANSGQIFSQPISSSSGFTFNSALTSIEDGIIIQIPQLITPTFTGLVNVSTGPGLVTKISGGGDWNAGAISVQSLTGSGKIQFTTTANTTAQMVGLSLTDPGGNFVAINYAVFLESGGIGIFESGTGISGSFPSYASGDIISVVVTGTTVTYQKNGSVFYTSLVAATFPLFFACSINGATDTVGTIRLQNCATLLAGDSISFPSFTYPGLGSIVGFSAFSVAGDVGVPGYILENRYWNGFTWVTSNGTYAQSNPASVVAANITTLPNNNTVSVKVITTASDGPTPMSIHGPLVITYLGEIYSNGTIQSNSIIIADMISSFASVFSETGSDKVTFAFNVNGVLNYWNGSAWVHSNGTLAQTNTAAVLNTNCGTLLNVNSIVQPYVLLTSASGSTTPNITSMTMNYIFGAINPTAPLTTIVFGFLCDLQGIPVAGASMIFSLINTIPNAYMAAGTNVLFPTSVTLITDANGFFSAPLVATTQFQGVNTFMQVVIKKGSVMESVGPDGQPLYLSIPIQGSIDITSLLSA